MAKEALTAKELKDKIDFYVKQREKTYKIVNNYEELFIRLNGAIESLIGILKESFDEDYDKDKLSLNKKEDGK